MANPHLLKNEIALDYSFQPKQLPFREKQYQEIIRLIKNFESGKNGINILVYGYPDIGKSHAIKSIIQEYEEKRHNAFVVYVNCWSKNISHKIILHICDAIDYYPNSNKKVSKSFDTIKNFFRKKPVIFIFDEIENLEDFEILEMISKSIDKKVVILITDNKQFFDNNLQSLLKVKDVEFKSYNLNETKGVFKQRIDIVLYPNVLDNDAFDLITKKSFEIGGLKLGLSILRKACTDAEMKCQRKITKMDVQRAIDNYKVEE